MKTKTLLGFLPLLLTLALPAGGADLSRPRPIVHEEMFQAWDGLAQQLQGLGNRLREHFTHREARGERPLITLMLRHRHELGLSSDQVRSLERLRADFQGTAIRLEADLRVAETDLATLLDAEAADLGQVEAKIREIERLRSDLRLARVRTIEQGKAQLSSEQRKKLHNLLSEPQYSRLRSEAFH
ncbi:MAG: Spy/CpxP family protein refolding chaperone [Candidatus Binatia bacterium]